MTNLKAWCESKWAGPMLNIGHGNVFTQEGANIRVRGGSSRNYKSKEQKAYEARFGIYNKKLVPIILAEANKSDASYMVIGDRKLTGPIYTWPAHDKQADARADAVVASVPRKRVSRVKLAKAAQIIEQVPPDQLTAFLARFGLSLSLAASIASLDNAEMIARQFLRATL